MTEPVTEAWLLGEPYERYVGRWSRTVAGAFLSWLDAPHGQVWGDVGCGTGALVEAILSRSDPQLVVAIDRSDGFLAAARARIADERARFEVADAAALPWADGSCDVSASGLVLNFVPDAGAMVREMARVTRPHGRVAAYVWDYSGGMEMMRHFWDAAVAVRPADAALDEGGRFPLCRPEPLEALFRAAGLRAIAVQAIDIPTTFRDFDDYWQPFLGKQGPAPTYLAALDGEAREQIRALLKARLAAGADGSIALTARAWAVQGTV